MVLLRAHLFYLLDLSGLSRAGELIYISWQIPISLLRTTT